MAWLSRNNFQPSDKLFNTDMNNLANDIRTWGSDVNGGGNHLYNVILDGGSGGGGAVSSVFGRVGDVVAQSGDYATFYPPVTRQVHAGTGLSGGGPLSADVTLSAKPMAASGTGHQAGIAPDPGATAGATRYLREDAIWAVPPAGTGGGMTDPTTTLGDLIVRGASATTRLGVGGDGQVLTADSSQSLGVKWATSGGAGAVTSVFGRTGAVVAQSADYSAYYVPIARQVTAGSGLSGGGALTADVTLTAIPMGPSGGAHAAGTVPDPGATAGVVKYLREDASWAVPPGTFVDPTANLGDLIVRGASSTTRLGVGGDGQVLTADSSQPQGLRWAPATGVSVSSVFGRTGSVVAVSTDYSAYYVPLARTVSAGTGLTGGGSLAANVTLSAVPMGASGTGHAAGIVPDPGATAGSTKFLREDATWVVPPSSPWTPITNGIAYTGGSLLGVFTPTVQANYGAAGFSSATYMAKLQSVVVIGNDNVDGQVQFGITGILASEIYSWHTVVGSNLAIQSSPSVRYFTPLAHGTYGYAAVEFEYGNIHFFGASVATTAGTVVTPIERMRITGAGNVGIGNAGTPPFTDTGYPQLILGPQAASNYCGVFTGCGNTSGAGNEVASYGGANYSLSYSDKRIAAMDILTDGSADAGYIRFMTWLGGTPTERMRISNSAFYFVEGLPGSFTWSMTPGSPTGCIWRFTEPSGLWGLYIGHQSNGMTWLQCARTDGGGATYPLTINASGGNVGIGTGVVSPTALLSLGPALLPIKLATYESSVASNCYGIGVQSGALTFGAQINANTGTPQMVLTSTGLLGIGTTSPGYPLHVYQSLSGGTALVAVDNPGGGANTGQGIAFNAGGSGSIGAILHQWDGTRWNLRFKAWSNSAQVERLTIQGDTGNVGINAGNPTSPLVVVPTSVLGTTASNTLPLAQFQYNSGNASYLNIFGYRNANGSGWTTASTRIQSQIDASPMGYVEFNVGGTPGLAFGTGTGLERMRIDQNGNVGIGTTNPVAHFECRNAAAAYSNGMTLGSAANVQMAITGDTNWGLYFGQASSGASWIQAARTDGNATVYPICLQTSGGNVGIGTTSPQAVLDVRGGAVKVGTYAYSAATVGDIAVSRDSATATGTIYFGNGGSYIWFNGTSWQFSPALPSDIRLKRNVRDLEGGLEVINKLRPVRAEWNGLGGHRAGERVVSLIAQELQQILPDSIVPYQQKLRCEPDGEWGTESQEFLSFEPLAIICHLIKAVQQLSQRVTMLEARA